MKLIGWLLVLGSCTFAATQFNFGDILDNLGLLRNQFSQNNVRITRTLGRRRPSPGRSSVPRPKPGGPCSLAGEPRTCDANSPFRTIDGSCNNLQHKNWGRSEQPFSRLLPPKYDEGDFRSKSKLYGELPSPRKVTTTLLSLASTSDFDNRLTNMHMLWGQFIDHDFTHAPMTPKVTCCDKRKEDRSENCIPISIPEDDRFWGKRGKTCMELRRSKAIKAGECGSRHRDQINILTSYIDGSAVYGSTDTVAKELRSFKRGQLKTSGDELLPIAKPSVECDIPPQGHPDKRCFMAGDRRSNVWAPLTALHLAFVRLHNKMAHVFYNKLKSTKAYYSERELDEQAYQESRRVTAAIFQVITYEEYLPNVLGKRLMKRYRLNLGGRSRYNPYTNPTAANSFGAATFRFGHSEIPFGTSPQDPYHQNRTGFVNMVDMFNQPTTYRGVKQDDWLRGVCVEPALNMEPRFSQEVLDRLFEKTFNNMGKDLPAVNIQRGREHGLPPYNDFRRFCHLRRARSFDDLPDHDYVMRQRLSQVYRDVDDIDLYAGAITERLVDNDAHVGPTFACLLGIQFQRFKEGDRFWFEDDRHNPYPFNHYQMEQIRKMTLAKVICETTDSKAIPKNVFLRSSRLTDCDSLPGLDLWDWL